MAKTFNLVTYAQNREDLILYVLLHGIKNGFYVDVGANDPVIDSVTKFFYDRGWHGINVEPIPAIYESIQKNRERDININAGVSNKPGSLTLREYGKGKHGWSTLSADTKKERSGEAVYQDYDVEVVTLAGILQAHNVKDIDFMKIDVEGLEYEVLSGNDWSKFRPKVVVVEDTEPAKWIPVLTKADYVEIYHDGLNRYFVRRDLRDEHTMSNYKDVLLSGAKITTAYDVSVEKQLRSTQKWFSETRDALQDSRQKYEQLNTTHNELNQKHQLIKSHPETTIGIKILTKALTKRVMQKFNPRA